MVAVETDGVWVETIRKSTCGACAVQKGCGHGILNRIYEGHRSLVRAVPGKLTPAECAVDDEVSISVPESVIVRGSLVVYIMPLIFMLAGAAAGEALVPAPTDLSSGIGAVLGFAIGFTLVRLHARLHRDDPALQPELVALLRRDTTPPGPG